MNKFVIPIIVVVILTVGIGVFFIFQKSGFPESQMNKCSDGGCDTKENAPSDKASLLIGEQYSTSNSPFGFIQGGFARVAELGVYWDKPLQEDAGAGWSAVEPEGDSVYDFSKLDETIKDAAEHKVHPYLVLKPINKEYGVTKDNGYPKKGDHGYRANWKTKLENYVSAVVDRYDNDGYMDLDEDSDGIQDVPEIKYWGIGHNEVDNDPYWKGRVEDYVDLVVTEYDAIKKACPDCMAVLGGASKSETVFDEGNFFYRVLTKLGASCSDIVIDYHWWGAPFKTKKGWAYKEHKIIIDKIHAIRQKAGINPQEYEIWTTEGGTYSDFNGATEKQQSVEVIKRYVYSLAHGQDKLFWTRIVEYDWKDDDNSQFDYTGLINNPENTDNKNFRKLSYYTYKKMVEILEGSDWNNIQTIQEEDGIGIYKFTKKEKSIWVAWNDNLEEKQITISNIPFVQVKIVESVPKYESGKEVINYNADFNTETKSVYDGKITIALKDKPVFMEEK